MISKVLLIIFLVLIGISLTFNIVLMGTVWGIVTGIDALGCALAMALDK